MDAEFQIQDFETNLLGVPVGRVSYSGEGAALSPDGLAELVAGWRKDGVWLVSSRVPEAWDGIASLEQGGFQAVETLVTFRCGLSGDARSGNTGPASGVTLAGPGDFEACLGIARRAFTNDRLHRDPRVPGPAADMIREQWVRNDLEGRADASFIVSAMGDVAGFNLCLLDGDEAVIDLIAVDTGHQQKGLGRALVRAAQDHYRGRAATMRVGTQADNEPSLALYLGAGFVESHRQTTFHWINPDEHTAPALTVDTA